MENSFVFLDFETTGLHECSDRIIEIAAVRYSYAGSELAIYETLVNSGVEIPPFITSLTGIDTSLVQKNGISPAEAIDGLLTFIGSDTVVAFNANFDMRFLLAEAKRVDLKIDHLNFCCALESARKAWPVFKRHNLKALSMFFDLPALEHRALGDCRNGAKIFSWSMSACARDKIIDCFVFDNLCITTLDIESLYLCNSGEVLKLWTKTDFPKINAYMKGSIGGFGLVASFEKKRNKWLLEGMNSGKVCQLKVSRGVEGSYSLCSE